MYAFLQWLFSYEEGPIALSVFGIWHFIYLILIFGFIIVTIYLARKGNDKMKKRIIDLTINAAFILYILDFFIMPFSYGYIDIDKLPFHICTLMGVMCFVSRNNRFFSKYKTEFTMLGLIGALMYIVYPSGVADGKVFPFSYRIMQTMIFHGLVVAHGIFALSFGDVKLEWKKIYKELYVIVFIAILAVVANNLYSGTVGDYSHNFNWFFVSQDPFGIFPEHIAPYVMPFVMVAVIFLMDVLIYLIYFKIKNFIENRKKLLKTV